VRAQLDDFEALTADLHLCPTRLAEIVPDLPSGIGAVDTVKVPPSYPGPPCFHELSWR
jgi:hypothetical protein